MKIFTPQHIDFTTEPLFFGSGRNASRLDLNIEPFIHKQFIRLRGLLWFPTDFTYQQDALDYEGLTPELKDLFLKNLKFQTLLDSVATRSVLEVFLPVTTSPRLEQWWVLHGYTESNHSDAYAEIVKALPVNATKVFDDILINQNIIDRGMSIVEVFDETVQYNAQYSLTGVLTDDHKRSLIKSLYALHILEACLFQSSFITTFAFGENKLMDGSTRCLSRISMDEKTHYAMSVYLINTLKTNPEWKYLFVELQPQITKMYQTAVTADYAWIDYLFEDNARLLGLNAPVLKQFVDYNAHQAMSAIGQPAIVDEIKMNPCSWATKYTNIGATQTAQKETDGVNYLLGALDKNMSEEDWENL